MQVQRRIFTLFILPVAVFLLAVGLCPAVEKDRATPVSAAAKTAPDPVPMPPLTKASKRLKNIPVGPTRVSFGVAQRTRVEAWDNRFLTKNRTSTNGLVYFRQQLWVDWNFHRYLRLFVLGQDSRKDGDTPARKRAWEDKCDLKEAYLDFRRLFGRDLTLRVGRQALDFGRGRLAGHPIAWTNLGWSFDAVHLLWKSDDGVWTADAFASKPVENAPARFDKQYATEEFCGLYATCGKLKRHRFDWYALARLDNNGKVEDELHRRGDRRIYTIGFRAYGKKIFRRLDYEVECAFQGGRLGKGDHRAAAAHAELGWTFFPAWKPRLMCLCNYATGDKDPLDGDHQAFDNLYPCNHKHYGYIDYQNWSNTCNCGCGCSACPCRGLKLEATARRFWLAESRDAWRNCGGKVLARDKTGRAGRDVGFELDVRVKMKFNRVLTAQTGFALFEGGEFVRRARPGRDEQSRLCWLQLHVRF